MSPALSQTQTLQTLPPSSTPAGITGGPFLKGYDRRLNVYNLKPYHLRRTRAALGKARASAGLAKLAFVGDSTSAGVGATPGSTDWPTQLAGMLSSAGCPSSGALSTAYKSSVTDSRWTLGSGWGALSTWSTLLTNSTTSNTAVYTSANTGTVVNVYYANTGGPFTVSIDGGAAVAVTPTGAQTLGTYSVTGLSNATHTVTITRTSGNVQIFAVEVQSSTTGVRIINSGIGGVKVIPAGSTGWFTFDAIASSSGGFNADLVVLMLETNDTGVTSVANYKTWLQGMVSTVKGNGSDLVLITAVPSSGKDFTAYNQALYELADANDIPLIDLQDRLGTYTLSNSYGLMSDSLHPNASGYAEVARGIFNALGL